MSDTVYRLRCAACAMFNLLPTGISVVLAWYFLPQSLWPTLLFFTAILTLAQQTLPLWPRSAHFKLTFILLASALFSVVCFNLPCGKWLLLPLAAFLLWWFSQESYLMQLIKVSSAVLLILGAMLKPLAWPYLFGVISLSAVLASLNPQYFMPQRALRSEAALCQRNGFRALAEFTQTLFAGLAASYYPQNTYSVERALHFSRTRCLSVIDAWQRVGVPTDLQATLMRLQETFTLLIDASQLRFRISDFTVFGLCADEIHGLGNALVAALRQLEYHQQLAPAELARLQQALAQWDVIYQQVINVSAREPVVFVLFTEALKRLVLLWEQPA